MTKPAGTPRKRPEPRRRKNDARSSQGILTPLTLNPPTLRNDVGAIPVTCNWPSPPDSAAQTTPARTDTARSFYLGSTSYASVFTDNEPLPDTVHEQPSERLSITPSLSSKTASSRHCQIGVGHSVVSRLAPFSFFEKSLKIYFERNLASALIGPLVLSLLPQLREDIQRLLYPGNDVYSMYTELTRNTALPLKVPSSMLPSQFHTLLTGKNLRWETLGLILVTACINAQYWPADDALFTLEDGRKVDKDRIVEDLIQATNDCITLCQVHGAVNDVMVWLVYTNMLAVSDFYGDNCAYITVVP
jgi:hypothetical protein